MQNPLALPILNPHAAGMDVGSEKFFVSVCGREPKVFLTVTGQIRELCRYLQAQGVRTVAMEATSIYWLCPYEGLERAGLAVVVVNGKYVKNLPGRKSDRKDCQWQATLHAHGLLQPGLVPPAHLRRLQDYIQGRTDHIPLAANHEQHMQQALARRNVKMAALAGNWKEAHLFALRQAYEPWPFYQNKIAEGDAQLAKGLQEITGSADPAQPAPPATKRGGINRPEIEGLHSLLGRLCGHKALTVLPGVADYVLLQLLAEVGTDLGKHWQTEKHFTAWMGLAPGSRQSGKRRGNQKRGRNRAGRLFCVIARRVGRSVDKRLGGFYRRLKGRRGGVANLALARKLAELFWRLLVHGIAYVEQGLKKCEAKVAQTEQRLLPKLARKYNLVLQPKAA